PRACAGGRGCPSSPDEPRPPCRQDPDCRRKSQERAAKLVKFICVPSGGMVVASAVNDTGGRSLQIVPERVDSLAGEIGTATAQFGNALRGVDDEVRNL